MADESLSAFISVETDADAAAAQIRELPGIVGQTVTQVNEQLSRLAQQNPFARVITDAERATLSIDQVQEAARATLRALSLVADANTRLGESGSAARVSGVGGVSIADIEAQNRALAEQLALMQQELALQRELRASSRFLPADGGSVRGSAAPSGLFGRGLPFTGGTQPGTAFLSDAEIEEARRQEQISAARQTLINAGRSSTPIIDPATEIGALTAIPIDIREDFAAIARAMEQGAVAFEGKSIIAVRTAFEGINGTIEPGVYNARTGVPLSAMDQLYYGGKSKFLGGGGGGGGFFGNFGAGITGGGGDGFNLGDLGTQAGVIGRYVLIYQVFRDIERAIKESVDQALQFDRAITDLSNRLQISKQEAQGLATNIGLVGAPAGLAPAETVGLAATYAGAFQGQAPGTALLGTGAQTAAQVQVLTGKVKEDLPDVIAAIQAFNLNFSDTQRVLDAATSSAQNYGLANAHDVLPGLAQIGDLAAQSGFSVEQTANALADIVTRTHDTSQAVAGQLQRFLGREGNPAFQQVFAQQGINTSQPFSQELEQLSEQFDKLSNSQKSFISSQFGGGRAGVAALAFIEDFQRILDNTQKSLDAGGVAQKNYANRLDDIVGAINAVRGELKELAKDVGTSGIGAGFAVAVEAAKPLLEILDEIVRLVNYLDSFGGHFPLGRDLVLAAAEITAAVALLGRLGVGARVGRIFGRGGESATPTSVAADATTGALSRLTAAADRATAALNGESGAATADADAKGADAAATTADAEAKTADAAATAENAVAQRAGILGAAGSALGRFAGIFGASGIGGVSLAGLGGAALSPAGIIGGALVVQTQVDRTSKIVNAESDAQNASTTAFNVGTDPKELQDQAQKLRQVAQQAESSSAGLFGAFDNVLGATLGAVGQSYHIPVLDNVSTETTGDVASRDREFAKLLQLEAQRANAAQVTSANGGDYVDLINLGKQGGVSDGLKTLSALGLDSAQQLDALNQKLVAFADASSSAANYLAHGASALAAQNYANAVTNTFIQVAQGAQVQGVSNGAEDRVAGKSFAKNVAPGLNQTIDQVTREFLQNYEGGNITPDDNRALAAQAKQAMITYLQAHGFSAKDIQKLSIELNDATLAATQTVIAQINAASGQAISPDAIGAVVAGLPQLLSGTLQEKSTKAALGESYGPFASGGQQQSTQEQGLRAALAKAQGTYNALSRTKGTTAQDLQGVQDQIDSYNLQLQEAIIANIDAEGQLALASIPPENQTAQIQAHIAIVQQQLAATKNPDDKLKLQTLNAQLNAQLASSQSQDTISAIGVGTNPANSVQVAADAAARAQATVADLIKRKVVGQALNNAEVAAAGAHLAYVQAVATDANAARDSQVAIGDKVGEAYAAYQDALTTASTLAGGARANALRDAAQKYQDYQVSLATRANEIRDANVRSGDPLAEARASLADARRSLAADQVGSDQFYVDLKAVHAAEANLAKSIADNARTAYLLHHDTTDPVAEAHAALVAAQTQYRQDQAHHTGNLASDSLSVEEAQLAEQKAKFDQQMQVQQDSYDLHQESAQQYLQFLESQDASLRKQLAGLKKGSEGYRQLVDELNQVDKQILGLADSIQGQFNLGDIITPTVYEARKLTQAQQAGTSFQDNKVVTITINGADPTATGQFLAAIEQHLGTSVATAASAVAPGGRKY